VTPPTKKQRLNHYNTNCNNNINNNTNNNNNTDNNIDNNNPSKNNGDAISCNKLAINEMDKNKWVKIIGGGLFLKFGFEQDLCTCDICMKTYMDNGYGFMFETNEDNNEDIDINNFKINSTEPLLAQFSTDVMMQDAISKMPRVQTIEALNIVTKATNLIKEKLGELLRESPNKKVITDSDVFEIFERAKNADNE